MALPSPTSRHRICALQRDRLEAELEDGERLVWAGRPSMWSIVLALFPWTGVVWLLMCSVLILGMWRDGGTRAGVAGAVIVASLIVMGLVYAAGPLWDIYRASRTSYAVTDRRAVLWDADRVGRVRVTSYRPDQLSRMYVRERKGGDGDLIFAESPSRSDTTLLEYRGFMALENAREVERVVRGALLHEPDWDGQPVAVRQTAGAQLLVRATGQRDRLSLELDAGPSVEVIAEWDGTYNRLQWQWPDRKRWSIQYAGYHSGQAVIRCDGLVAATGLVTGARFGVLATVEWKLIGAGLRRMRVDETFEGTSKSLRFTDGSGRGIAIATFHWGRVAVACATDDTNLVAAVAGIVMSNLHDEGKQQPA